MEDRDLSGRNRGTITKLLVAEEDKLSCDLQHLEFAESQVSKCRQA